MLTKNIFGIDLGTSTVKIYSLRRNRLLVEKDMIAIRGGNQVIAVGDAAFEMYEKTPPDVTVDHPVSDGRIADTEEVEMLLRILLTKTDSRSGLAPVVFFSAPYSMSALEKKAYRNVIDGAGDMRSPHAYLSEAPLCDAISFGIPISRTRGSMILNMGAESTTVSVIAGGQIIVGSRIPCGGHQLNTAVIGAVRKEMDLIIGQRTARRLKAVLATFSADPRGEARRVVGMDTLSGLPREEVITEELVCRAVEGEVSSLADKIKVILERIPPQISKSIAEEGIYLTGGLTRIPDIGKYIARRTGCRVNVSGQHELSTIAGLEEIIKRKELRKLAASIKG